MRAGSGGSEGENEQGEARGMGGGGQGSPPLKLGPIGTPTGAKVGLRRCSGSSTRCRPASPTSQVPPALALQQTGSWFR